MAERRRMHANEQDRAAAAAFCAGRDVRCPGCGYNLRDSVDGVCSECGRALRLRTTDDPAARRALYWLIFAWSALMGAGPLGIQAVYWKVYGELPDVGLTATLIAIANVAGVIYGVAGMITLAITRRPPAPLSPWWMRVGWVVLLSVSAHYVVAMGRMSRVLFEWSLYLPF